MATTAIRLFTDESVSLRSFRLNSLSNSAPSLKASSLKIRSSLAFSNILTPRGRTPKRFEPTLNDLIRNSEHIDTMGLPTNDLPGAQAKNNTPAGQTEQPRPRSRSRTIIRMLTTKFSTRSGSTSISTARSARPSTTGRPSMSARPSMSRPSMSPPPFIREQREAALRERGLLPPLRPNKDLSQQEMEQDQGIPIVSPAEPNTNNDADIPSAANQIKKEWEAKNSNLQEVERQKIKSFKFGGNSPSSPSIQDELAVPSLQFPELTRDADVQSDVPSPNEHLSQGSHMEQAPLQKSLTLDVHWATSQPISDPNYLTLTPVPEMPPEVEAHSVPLPPSPSPSRRSVDDPMDHSCPPLSPTSVPLPPSPSPLTVSLTPTSLNCPPSPVVVVVPEVTPENPESTGVTQAPPILPAISFTPPSAFLSPINVDTSPLAPDDLISSAFHARIDSFAQLEATVSSNMTASLDELDSSSPSTIDTESSFASGKGKLGALAVKVHEGNNIPIIVESPTEDIFSDELYVVVEDSAPGEEKGASVEEEPKSPRPARSRRMPFVKRGLTDPSGLGVERKKSLNPFKRGNTVGGGNPTESSDSPQRRVSVVASLSSVRRSVVGTLSRPTTLFVDASGQKMFNASRLPPSPTSLSPTSPSSPTGSRRVPGLRPPPRQAVSPTIYTRGSILMEASTIEDEETRRMTELAFM